MLAGLQAAQQHRLEEAIAEFRKVTELAPALPAGYVRLGQVYMESGKFDLALAPLKRALELDPDVAAAHKLIGYALLARGYAAESIPHFKAVQDFAGLGIAQIEMEQASDAVTNLQAALAQQPNNPDLLFFLSRASEMLSLQTTEMLLKGFPGSARAHQVSGKTFYNLRQMPEAEKEYQQALALGPETPGLHLELGQIYAFSSQWSKAEQEYRQEAEHQPGNAEVAYRLGDALLQQGKAEEAKRELDRSDKLRPNMSETLYALGKASSQMGDEATAERAWLRVVELEKESPLAGQAHFNLAALYRKQRKLQQAETETQAFRKSQNQSGNAGPQTQR
jgi:tetratricopeptide (TPR) repeat protein